MRYLIFSVIISLLSCTIELFSQDVKVSAEIDTNDVLIGDWINLSLTVQSGRDTKVIFPALGDTLGKIEVVSRTGIDTVMQENDRKLIQKFALTAFDSGAFSIPQFTFMYEKEGHESLFPAKTDSIVLRFSPVPVDTAKPIKDIKGPLEEPLTFEELLPYIGIGLGALLVIAAVIYFLKRYKTKSKSVPLKYDPTVPPHLEALRRLRELEQQKLWQNGEVKKYYVRLTEILRIYLERRFGIPAMEETSGEILDAMEKSQIEADLTGSMRTVFETADLVKFAKHEPLPDVNSKCISYVREFIEKTKQEETSDNKNKEAGN